MSEHVFTRQIGEYMRDRVKSQLEAELSLKTCHYGDLDPFPTSPTVVADTVPAVFFQPERVDSDFATINQRYAHFYTYRVIYVGTLPEGQTQEHARRIIERVADVIWEDIRMDASSPGPDYGTPAKAQTVWSIVKNIQYRPPEDNFLVSINANLFASALTWQVQLRMFR